MRRYGTYIQDYKTTKICNVTSEEAERIFDYHIDEQEFVYVISGYKSVIKEFNQNKYWYEFIPGIAIYNHNGEWSIYTIKF